MQDDLLSGSPTLTPPTLTPRGGGLPLLTFFGSFCGVHFLGYFRGPWDPPLGPHYGRCVGPTRVSNRNDLLGKGGCPRRTTRRKRRKSAAATPPTGDRPTASRSPLTPLGPLAKCTPGMCPFSPEYGWSKRPDYDINVFEPFFVLYLPWAFSLLLEKKVCTNSPSRVLSVGAPLMADQRSSFP